MINPVFYYLLHNFEDLSKRAYVANFLVSMEIPENIAADEEVNIILY